MNIVNTKEWEWIMNRATTNSKNDPRVVYLMWDAGTGKSTTINMIREKGRSMAVAPTNTAAINIDWTTFYKNLSIRPDISTKDVIDDVSINHLSNLRTTQYMPSDIFIIDEVSMIDADNMDLIFLIHIYRDNTNVGKSAILKHLNTIKSFKKAVKEIVNDDVIKIPKILISWDFWQLPPVLKKDRREYLEWQWYKSPYAFDSYFRREIDPTPVVLKHNFRQSNPDNHPDEKKFIDVLKNIKYDTTTGEDIEFLNRKVITNITYQSLDPKPLLISTTNARVLQVNKRNVDAVKTQEHIIKNRTFYYKRDSLSDQDRYLLTKTKWGKRWYNAFVQDIKNSNKIQWQWDVLLKEWCQIMVTGNDYSNASEMPQFYNGQIWKFLDITKNKSKPAIKVELWNQALQNWYETIIPEQVMNITEQVYDKFEKRIKTVTVGNYSGIPITHGYAITTHKSQWKSLERLIIDPNDGMYEENQAYVAISRATNYENLWFYRPIQMTDLKYNRYILLRMSDRIKQESLANEI